jgi:phage FluMu protein Com
MPLFYLELFCELEGVEKLIASKATHFEFSVRCTHCNEEHGKHVVADAGSLNSIPGSRGEAHIVVKCRNCERVSSIELVEGKWKVVCMIFGCHD